MKHERMVLARSETGQSECVSICDVSGRPYCSIFQDVSSSAVALTVPV